MKHQGSSGSSKVLKQLQAAQQAKKDASARMTSVTCSTAIFPKGFEVDPEAKAQQQQHRLSGLNSISGVAPSEGSMVGSPSATMISATATSHKRESSVGGESDESIAADGQPSPVAAAGNIALSTIENQWIVQQVHYNVELLKHRLFSLLDMNVLPTDEDASLSRIDELQKELAAISWAQHAAASHDGPSVGAATGGAVPGSSSRPATPGSGGRPSSATRRNLYGSSSAFAPKEGAPLPQPSKLLVHTQAAVDSYFRFAFEELSLRWVSLQDRPFSLRAFHQVAREQIRLREEAAYRRGVMEHNVDKLDHQVKELQFKIDHHNSLHAQNMQLLLSENKLLRSRLTELMQKLKIDEPIPTLFDHKKLAGATQAGTAASEQMGSGGDTSDGSPSLPVDPNEKHYETLNRRLTEECALLSHSLEQRSGVVKALTAELQIVKSQAAGVKEEFRKYVQEQEALDQEFRRTFVQNEKETESAKREAAAAVKKAADAEARAKEVAARFSAMEEQIARLDSERNDALAERDHLRKVNDALVAEAEAARQALEELQAKSALEAAAAAEKLEAAEKRIFELENDGTKQKLEVALKELAASQEKCKQLQRAVENRDKQIALLKQEHKAEISRMEGKVSQLQEEIQTVTSKFEDLLVRERQKGIELAERKVAEAKREFSVERDGLLATIRDTERMQDDLAHELFLFHRQSTILERFLRDHLDKEALRQLGRRLLRRDIRNTKLNAGGESESECSPLKAKTSDTAVDAVSSGLFDGSHTPRTRLYFGHYRLFEPEEVQYRLTLAGEAPPGTSRTEAHVVEDDKVADDGGNPRIPLEDAKSHAPLLLKSAMSLDFLRRLMSHEKGTDDDEPRSFLAQRKRELAQEREDASSEARVPAADTAEAAESAESTAAHSGRTVDQRWRKAAAELLAPQAQMLLHDMKSEVVAAKLEKQALQDELDSLKRGDHLISHGIQTSFAGASTTDNAVSQVWSKAQQRGSGVASGSNGGAVAGGGAAGGPGGSRPSSGLARSLQSSVASGVDSPTSSAQFPSPDLAEGSLPSMPGTLMIARARGSAAAAMSSSNGLHHVQRTSTSLAADGIPDDDDSASLEGDVLHAAAAGAALPRRRSHSGGDSASKVLTTYPHQEVHRTGSSAATSVLHRTATTEPGELMHEFPGIEHAMEFGDLFETFVALRGQLASLVDVCQREARRGALHPDDLTAAQENLLTKFSIFRAVEAQNQQMLNRLHKKKEDVMRRKEEELEKVLLAMQNISNTHPKEAQTLLRIAKSATRRRQLNPQHPIPLSDDDGGTTNAHDRVLGDISAVIVRPVSQQSVRRLTPIPSNVAVSGSPALMSLRLRTSSAGRKAPPGRN